MGEIDFTGRRELTKQKKTVQNVLKIISMKQEQTPKNEHLKTLFCSLFELLEIKSRWEIKLWKSCRRNKKIKDVKQGQ